MTMLFKICCMTAFAIALATVIAIIRIYIEKLNKEINDKQDE